MRLHYTRTLYMVYIIQSFSCVNLHTGTLKSYPNYNRCHVSTPLCSKYLKESNNFLFSLYIKVSLSFKHYYKLCNASTWILSLPYLNWTRKKMMMQAPFPFYHQVLFDPFLPFSQHLAFVEVEVVLAEPVK